MKLKLDKSVQVYSDGSSRIADPASYFKGNERLRSHLDLMDKVKERSARVRYARAKSAIGFK